MRKTQLTLALCALLIGCGAFWSTVQTMVDIADCLCQKSAASRTEAERAAKSDEQFCVEHAAEYLEAVTAAKAGADRKAGLSRVAP